MDPFRPSHLMVAQKSEDRPPLGKLCSLVLSMAVQCRKQSKADSLIEGVGGKDSTGREFGCGGYHN